jgi:hypothetical protein
MYRVRKVRTKSGSTAIQVIQYIGHQAKIAKHIGSAKDDMELDLLLKKAHLWIEEQNQSKRNCTLRITLIFLNSHNIVFQCCSFSWVFLTVHFSSEDEAEELVQEVFTIIWEKHTDLKEELSFKSFLFTIAFNIIKKHFRTKHLY